MSVLKMLAASTEGASENLIYNGATYPINGSGTSLSVTNVNIGPESSDRMVVIMIAITGSTSPSITSMTIGGVTATQATGNVNGSVRRNGLYYANVPTGTTATVVVNYLSNNIGGLIASSSVYGLSSYIPYSANFSYSTSTAISPSRTVTLTFPAGGVVVAFYSAGAENAGTLHSCNVITEVDDISTSPSGFLMAQMDLITGGSTSVTVTGTDASVARPCLCVATWSR
jgi:hypothetical protein